MGIKMSDLPDEEILLSGSGACPGCSAILALRIVGKALGENSVAVLTPSCSVASLGVTPRSVIKIPALNVTFASAGSSATGLSAAYSIMKEKGLRKGEEPTIFNWVGDGGTYDIGLQAISAAAERNENFIHFCYNNEAYSNTGVQRSGATPRGCYTTTTPGGKAQTKKNMSLLMLEHNVPYVATATVAYPMDLYEKVKKAKSMKGFKYIEIFAPCNVGWQFHNSETIEMSRMAVDSGACLLWEAVDGKIEFSHPTDQLISGKRKLKPVNEYLEKQGRFNKILKNCSDRDQHISEIQNDILREIKFMKKRAEIVY